MKTLNTIFQSIQRALLVPVTVACALPFTMSANLLPNPGFEYATSGVTPGTPVSYTAFCGGATSAALYWRVWVNSCGSNISTTLVNSSAPSGNQYMLHVVTTGPNNGIYTTFLSTQRTIATVWVYLNSGCIGIGTGNGAETGDTDEMTCVTGRWFQLYQVPNGVSPGSEFIVYSVPNPILPGSGGADFFLDNADVDPQP
jgi:hypothetical protein